MSPIGAAPPNNPNASKKWSWPLLPLVGIKSRIDQAFTTARFNFASFTASANGRFGGAQGVAQTKPPVSGSTHRPCAAPARMTASA